MTFGGSLLAFDNSWCIVGANQCLLTKDVKNCFTPGCLGVSERHLGVHAILYVWCILKGTHLTGHLDIIFLPLHKLTWCIFKYLF